MKLKRFSTAGSEGRFFQRLNEWAEIIERHMPGASVPGALTSKTTQGSFITPTAKTKASSSDGPPVWL